MIPNKSGGILKSQNSSIRTAAGSSKNYEYIEKRTGSGSVELKILEDDDITTSRRYRHSEPLRQK